MADSLPVRHRTQTGNVRPPLFFPLCVSLRSLRESNPPSSSLIGVYLGQDMAAMSLGILPPGCPILVQVLVRLSSKLFCKQVPVQLDGQPLFAFFQPASGPGGEEHGPA